MVGFLTFWTVVSLVGLVLFGLIFAGIADSQGAYNVPRLVNITIVVLLVIFLLCGSSCATLMAH